MDHNEADHIHQLSRRTLIDRFTLQ